MGVAVLGSIILDEVCRVERLPSVGETVLAESFEVHPGGKGANQAVAAAAWGARSALIGAVGQDGAGAALIDHLTGRGVDLTGVARISGAASGRAHICVAADGRNQIVVIPGANARVDAARLADADIGGARVMLAQFETPLEGVAALLRRAGETGIIRILNAAPALAAGRPLLALADIIVVNQGELGLFAGAAEPVDAQAAAPLARALIGRSGQIIVVTLAEAGALAVGESEVVRVEGHRVEARDTTGAGDCFCGVLAAALAGGESLARALAWANAAAALSTEYAGAAAPASLRGDTSARFGGAI